MRFKPAYDRTPIARNDVAARGEPRLAARALDAEGALGFVLYYISAMYEHTLQQLFGTTMSCTSRLLHFGQRILLSILREADQARICWPRDDEAFAELASLVRERYSLLNGCFGFIDGVKFPIHAPGAGDIELAYYNGWVGHHCVSCIFVFSSKGEIVFAVYNTPGSVHDSMAARTVYDMLRYDTPDGYFIAADSAFPTNGDMRNRIKKPINSVSVPPVPQSEVDAIIKYDKQLTAARQSAEWGMRALQGAFGRLRLPLPEDNDDRLRFRSKIVSFAWFSRSIRSRLRCCIWS